MGMFIIAILLPILVVVILGLCCGDWDGWFQVLASLTAISFILCMMVSIGVGLCIRTKHQYINREFEPKTFTVGETTHIILGDHQKIQMFDGDKFIDIDMEKANISYIDETETPNVKIWNRKWICPESTFYWADETMEPMDHIHSYEISIPKSAMNSNSLQYKLKPIEETE